MPITPGNPAGGEVDREHFIVERAVVRFLSDHRGGCSSVSSRCDMKYFFAVGNSYRAKRFITTRNVTHPIRYASGTVHRTSSSEFPDQRAVRSGDAVQVFVIRTDQNPVAHYDWRGLDLAVGFEGPESFAVSRADCVNRAVQIADVDHAVGNTWRRFADGAGGFVFPPHSAVR